MARILIADDDEPTLAVLDAAVRGWHHKTELSREAASVPTAVRAFKPELLLLDYQFPTASGAQVLQRVRTLAEGADVPVIFISGSPQDMIKFNVGEHSNVRFLGKPVDLKKLKSAIEDLLAQGPQDAPGFEILK
jgi:DNA-binding response OmpR family regulator